MSLHVGRVTLPDPMNMTRTPRGLSFDGRINRASDGAITIEQLVGLGDNPDEPEIPVWWDHDPIIDGFYQVGSVDWRAQKGEGGWGNSFPFSVALERVAGNPGIESRLLGAVRDNAMADDSDVVGWHAVPRTVDQYLYGWDGSVGYSEVTEREGADGTVAVYIPDPAHMSEVALWSPPIEDYYVGAASIYDRDGNLLLGHAGRPASVDNGLLRVTIAETDDDPVIRVAGWSGGDWGVSYDFSFLLPSDAAYVLKPDTARILQNTPAQVSICLNYGGTEVFPYSALSLYFTLRRGARMVGCTAKFPGSLPDAEIVTGSGAATALDGGVRLTADDASGDRWVLASTVAHTAVTGGFENDAGVGDQFQFGIGVEVGGSDATSPNDAQSLIEQYMAAQDETQMVVQR